MLYALERLLHAAIDAALPGAVPVPAGPYAPAGSGAVVVHVRDLDIEPPPAESEEEEPAHLIELATWSADGSALDFDLPAGLAGELIEVESPPGKTARAGDDYYVEDRTIHFYRAPGGGPTGGMVRARLRGAQAAGWSQRRRGTVRVAIAAWAADMEDADERLEQALHTALAALVDAPNFEAGTVAGAAVWMRVLAPRTGLAALRRGIDASSGLVHASAELTLRVELDLVVARGTPAPAGIIEGIAGTVTVRRPGQETAVPETFAVARAPAEDTQALAMTGLRAYTSGGQRPIEARPVDVLAGVGRVARDELAGLHPPVDSLLALAAIDADAIEGRLARLSPGQVRAFAHQATLVLAFPPLPPLPPAALSATLATLLALSPGDLAVRTGLGMARARELLADLLTLRILLTESALGRIPLADFVPA